MQAPAAFGLVTFLLLEHVDIRVIRKHLLFFSIAAPIGAFITYLAIVKVRTHFHWDLACILKFFEIWDIICKTIA